MHEIQREKSREVWPPAYLVSDLRYYLWDGAGSTGQVVPAPRPEPRGPCDEDGRGRLLRRGITAGD